jgi:starch synthase
MRSGPSEARIMARAAAASKPRCQTARYTVAVCSAIAGHANASTARAEAMGRAGRRRAVEAFAWPAIAEQTATVYRAV